MKRKKRLPFWQGKSHQKQAETLLNQAERSLEQQLPEQALDILNQVPEKDRNNPEYHYLRGLCLMMKGDKLQAIDDLEIATRQDPPGSPRLFQLAQAYMSANWLCHAWKYADKYLQSAEFDHKMTPLAHMLSQQVKASLTDQAEILGVSFQELVKAAIPNETAQRHLQSGRLKEAIRECDIATRRLRSWASPRNNKAFATFLSGKVKLAIRIEEEVLATIDADNVQALGNLIMFHFSTLDDDAILPYAARLRQLVSDADLQTFDFNKAIEALALIEDEETLWAIAERMEQQKVGQLTGSSWYVLGAAAANRGRVTPARRFFEYAQTLNAHPPNWPSKALQCLANVWRKRRQVVKGFSFQERFPYMHHSQFFPPNLIQEMMAAGLDEENERAQAGWLAQKYPFVAGGYRLILWHETEEALRNLALDGLAQSDDEAAHRILLEFAQSQVGALRDRMEVLRILQEFGHIPRSEKIRLWNDEKNEWFEGNITLQEITDPENSPCNEEAMAWQLQALELTKGGNAGEAEHRQAITYLEKAIAADGDCAMAVHNLGIHYFNLGEKDRGEALIRQSVEIDPDYLYGYCTLAGFAIDRSDFDEAKSILQKVETAHTLTPAAYERMMKLQYRIAIEKKEYETAERILDLMEQYDPDLIDFTEKRGMLNLLKITGNVQRSIQDRKINYRKKQLNKPIRAEAQLSTCLNRISRENLAGTLRAWHVQTSGRKAEVIARLYKTMLEPVQLADFVEKTLTEEERKALSALLKEEGVMPRQVFIERFDDDFEESPYWQYYEAETISGRLQMFGLAAAGTLKKQWVMLIPADLRPLLSDIL